MPDNSLVRQIALGEDSLLELKLLSIPGKRVVEPDARDLADEFAAAANSHGASFIFGVDDKTKEVKGIEPCKLDVAETWLRNICNDSIKPPIGRRRTRVHVADDRPPAEGASRNRGAARPFLRNRSASGRPAFRAGGGAVGGRRESIFKRHHRKAG